MGRRRCRYSIMKRKKFKTIVDEEKKVHIHLYSDVKGKKYKIENC